MPRALLVADVSGWAFDVNNRGIEKYALSGYDVDHYYVSKKEPVPDYGPYDVVFMPHIGWDQFDSVPYHKKFGSFREQATSFYPSPSEIGLINGHAAFYVVNRSSFELLQPVCPGIRLLTNPVDTDVFDREPQPKNRIVCQWNGNAKHGNNAVKGLEILVGACQLEDIQLFIREYNTLRLAHEEMPDHYACANVALCASIREGASNSVMEAMACGQALITTECGNVREMRNFQLESHGDTGIVIVDRSVDAFRRALSDLRKNGIARILEMGRINKLEIQRRWSWKVWTNEFRELFSVRRYPKTPPENKSRYVFYVDTPRWAQHIFVTQLSKQTLGWDHVESSRVTIDSHERVQERSTIYTPVARAADVLLARNAGKRAKSLGGLWSHVSYGGWFTDDSLDSALLPTTPTHATNLYLHALTGLPYLAGGVDTDLFHPPTEDRREHHKKDKRIVIGWTGSLEYNAAVKLFLDLWICAVRMAGSDGRLSEAKVCARPLAVWNCLDARSPDEVAEYLRGIDIYLCTSISEGCSNSLLEAAASGCMIISTPCGNAPELASEIVGWNAREIADVIRFYERNREALYEAREVTRERAERFWSWKCPIKSDAWKLWLETGTAPSWKDQVPYLERDPDEWLRRSRNMRESAIPRLVRGNMMGS